jgi:hypothetical protein
MADHCFTASITCNYCPESEETNGQCYRAQLDPRPHDCGNPVPRLKVKYSNSACGKTREKESLAVTLQKDKIEVVARAKEAEEKKEKRKKEKDEATHVLPRLLAFHNSRAGGIQPACCRSNNATRLGTKTSKCV